MLFYYLALIWVQNSIILSLIIYIQTIFFVIYNFKIKISYRCY